MKKGICLFFIFVQVALYSQVKIGFNTKLISTNSQFEVESKNGTKFVITKDSVRVGIGNTNPTFPLEVMGSNTLDAIAIGNTTLMSSFRSKISSQGSSTNDRWMKFNADWGTTSNNTRAFGFFRGTNEYLTILDNGRIGIGTSSPSAKLTVNGTIYGKENITIYKGTATEGGQINLESGTSINTWTIDQFEGNNSPRLRIFNGNSDTNGLSIIENGRIGIGLPNPTEKIDILGNLKVSGAIMPNNNAGINGQVLTSSGSGVAPVWSSKLPQTNRIYLTSTFSSSSNSVWVDIPGLSITVPAGISELNYNIWGLIDHNGEGYMRMVVRLWDVTSNLYVDYSTRDVVSSGAMAGYAATTGGTASFNLPLNIPTSRVYKVQLLKLPSGGSPNVNMAVRVEGGSYIEYKN